MIMGLVLVISLAFSLLMAIAILEESKRNIATLKLMGYTNRAISIIYLTAYAPSFIVAIIASIPFSYLALSGIQRLIIDFGGISIPNYLDPL
jgi:ABC-type lipoprotein release transport system permease subunit